MKLFSLTISIFTIAAMTACSSGGKKVLIMASGKLTVDGQDQKKITIQPGTTHVEKEIYLSGGEKETLTVEGAGDKKTFDVTEAGNYLLNLKPDTLVGGAVTYGASARTSNLTGEDVDHIIDSTQQLILGKNVSDEKKTYFILPYTVKKLSSSMDSKIVGPYNGIPSSVDAGSSGKMPEVYKLYTNKQKREAVEALIIERKK